MSIDKICFLLHVPLTGTIYKNYGFEDLMARGFAICFVDMTDYYNPEYRQGIPDDHSAEKIEVVRVKKQKDFIDYLKREDHKNTFFVVNIAHHYDKGYFMFRALGKFKNKYAIYAMSPSPIKASFMNVKKNGAPFFERISRKIRNLAISFVYSLPAWLNGIKAPTFVLAGGRKLIEKLPRADGQTKILYAHMPNYDNYLSKKGQIAPGEQNYFVFLDQYLPFNPDLLIPANSHLRIDPEKYYQALNRFFDYLEKTFNTKVVIAAHPASQYHLKPDLFHGRKIEKGRTLELIAASRCVLTHYCTSIDYAFLYKKPILIFTSDEIDMKMGSFIHGFDDILGKKPINMDDERYAVSGLPQIDPDAYKAYITNYLKYPGTPDKPYWDIIADNIKMLDRQYEISGKVKEK